MAGDAAHTGCGRPGFALQRQVSVFRALRETH